MTLFLTCVTVLKLFIIVHILKDNFPHTTNQTVEWMLVGTGSSAASIFQLANAASMLPRFRFSIWHLQFQTTPIPTPIFSFSFSVFLVLGLEWFQKILAKKRSTGHKITKKTTCIVIMYYDANA